MRNTILLSILLTILVLGLALAGVPTLINYQGQLTDTGGNPVADGTYDVTFTIYDDPTAGSVLWSSGVRQIDVSGGLFTYILGDSVALNSDLFANDSGLWLGIQIEGDPEMTPRAVLTATPRSAISSGVYGDIKTSSGRLLLDNSSGSDTEVVILNEVNSVDHRGHVTILKISNNGSDTTDLVSLIGEDEFQSLVVGDDDGSDSVIVLTGGIDRPKHHGHVTILKIANNGSDTTDLVSMSATPVSQSISLGDNSSPDSGIVISGSTKQAEHRGHVTILKISNNGSDTTDLVGLYGDDELQSLVVGDDDGSDSGIVLTNTVDKHKHRGHVTILKIANNGADTTELIGLSADPGSQSFSVGESNSPDSGIVLTNAVDKTRHRGHVTILKISNNGADTTNVIRLDGSPSLPSLVLGDGSADSGIVLTNTVDKSRHRGHVTILKIANNGSDTTNLVSLSGDPLLPSLVVGDYDPTDSGIVVTNSVAQADHRGHVTILKISNGGADTTDIISMAGDENQATLQLNGGGGSGGSILLSTDVGSSSGQIGVNTLSPAYEIDVVGTICATGGMCAPSDVRLKKDIAPVTDGLSIVNSLNPVRYNWRRDEFPQREFAEQNQTGLIAQEVQKILPELVSQGADGFYSLDYARLTPVLVAAIKDQQATIETLTERLAQLEKLVTKLTDTPTTASPQLGLK